MGIDKINPLGETGGKDTDTVLSTWVDNGWVDERVRYKALNKVFNRSDNKINEIIERGPGCSLSNDPYSIGVFSPDISTFAPYDGANIIDPTASAGGTNTDLVYTVIHGKRVILTVKNATRLTIYDIDEMDFLEDIEAATLGLPLGSIISACGDGQYVYVLYAVSGTPDQYWVKGYDPDNSWAEIWSSGTQLEVYEQSFSGHQAKIRMANSDKLYVTCPWVEIDSGTDAAVTILDKGDGSIDGSGAGDVNSSSTGHVHRACSNGTYIFMLIFEGSNYVISSMSISSQGATGCGWKWLPSQYASWSTVSDVGCCGETIVVTHTTGNLYTRLTTGYGITSYFLPGDADKAESLGRICCDGLNFWAIGTRENLGGTSDVLMLYRLDGAHIGGYWDNSSWTAESYTDGENYVTPYKVDDFNRTSHDFNQTIVASDGDSIWSNIYYGVSGEDTKIARLRRSLLR
jgi:hypothetical protein